MGVDNGFMTGIQLIFDNGVQSPVISANHPNAKESTVEIGAIRSMK
eukprot:CAMPEP_0185574164 /NCGR_PEP_ID=MMETSP0434-20130131/5706_1 /TAXON_ID=626734 ORGANISM="Favella taraikaensis, Strain Fe Narragansett Bay" /NCGR_SAMPLE_ID=MMETSP0434 /ASSEMBLY_ACC=CAM_ASM_000379 /LENGTH=45 /DNA_ID= /DNA_START= /DNA_END= /DNA_ORIENTATION=